MSYSRWPVYIWSDGNRIHLWVNGDDPDVVKAGCGHLEDPEDYNRTAGIHMPEKMFDELVLCRYAQMARLGLVEKTLRRIKRSSKKPSPFKGNFGSFDLLEFMGEDPRGDFRKRCQAVAAIGPESDPSQ